MTGDLKTSQLDSRLAMARAAFARGAVVAGPGPATDLAREATELVHSQDRPLAELRNLACELADRAAALHAAFAGLAGVICSIESR